MHIDYSELYRLLTRSFRKARYDDVRDVIQATIVHAWEHNVVKEPLVNEQAFANVVARRMMQKIVNYRQRFVYPDRESAHGWETLQIEEGCLLTEQHTDTELDVENVLKVLPDHYAWVLRRHYLEGTPLCEIAKELDVEAPTMRKRHERALSVARKFFQQGLNHAEDP
jgi:RNA polymerase sigma factor (sigma-70 family)